MALVKDPCAYQKNGTEITENSRMRKSQRIKKIENRDKNAECNAYRGKNKIKIF